MSRHALHPTQNAWLAIIGLTKTTKGIKVEESWLNCKLFLQNSSLIGPTSPLDNFPTNWGKMTDFAQKYDSPYFHAPTTQIRVTRMYCFQGKASVSCPYARMLPDEWCHISFLKILSYTLPTTHSAFLLETVLNISTSSPRHNFTEDGSALPRMQRKKIPFRPKGNTGNTNYS